MNPLQIIDEHTVIRETVGYKLIEKIDVVDLPEVLKFLNIVWNYMKMVEISK